MIRHRPPDGGSDAYTDPPKQTAMPKFQIAQTHRRRRHKSHTPRYLHPCIVRQASGNRPSRLTDPHNEADSGKAYYCRHATPHIHTARVCRSTGNQYFPAIRQSSVLFVRWSAISTPDGLQSYGAPHQTDRVPKHRMCRFDYGKLLSNGDTHWRYPFEPKPRFYG